MGGGTLATTCSWCASKKKDRVEKLIAKVKHVLLNGNLFIQGHNPVQRLHVSGLVRAMDIAQDNSVRSSYVVNVEFSASR